MEPLLYHQPQTILNVVGQLLLLSPAQPEVNAVSELLYDSRKPTRRSSASCVLTCGCGSGTKRAPRLM